MPGHHFLGYSRFDAVDFALRLHDALEAGTPPFAVWLDKIDLKPGQDWDEQIAEAIRVCGSLLFVMTSDSVIPQSTCKLEWTRALKYKKPIIPSLYFIPTRRCPSPSPRGSILISPVKKSLRGKSPLAILWLTKPVMNYPEIRSFLSNATI